MDHFKSLNTINNIANIFIRKGKLEEALDLFNRCLAINLKTHGEEHLMVADNYLSIAFIHRQLKQYKESLQKYE